MNAALKKKLKERIPHKIWNALVSSYRFLTRLRYKIVMRLSPGGGKYACPCCGLRFDHFIEGDYSAYPEFYDLKLFERTRQDVLCPVCGSLPRHRILASWCDGNRDLIEGKDILYFAYEECMAGWFRRNRISFTTADLYDPDCDLKIDIQETGLPEASYDVIICNHVLEHVGDYMKALRELSRILKPEGIFILSFPVSQNVDKVLEDPEVSSSEARLKVYGQSDHVRLFGMNAHLLLADAGFSVRFIDGKDFPDDILPVTGPGRYDINRLYLCTRTDSELY